MLKLREAKHSLFPLSLFHTFRYSHASSPFASQNPRFLHVSLIKRGLAFEISFATDLLLAYFLTGETTDAQSLFRICFKNSIRLLNYKVKQLSIAGFHDKILYLYHFLQVSDTKPDNFTFPYALKACAVLPAFEEGAAIHSHIFKSGLGLDLFIANSLVHMYSMFGSLLSARHVFDEMPQRNLVSWNSMVLGYGLNGFPDTALELCSSVRYENMRLDKVSMKIILPICGLLGAVKVGKSIHAVIITSGLFSDLVLVTAIMDMYAKCGDLYEAERLFNRTAGRDVITWNALISGYSKAGKLKMVLELFHEMQKEDLTPSVVTLLIVFQACTDLAVLHIGESVHAYITRLGLSFDASVEALLIDMYSKCGKLNSAYFIFKGISKGNVNSWSAMIYGFGMHGFGEAAVVIFFNMLKRGIYPDDVCFLVVLSSCSHNGLVSEGRKFFYHMMKHFGVKASMEHHASLVDLLGRAGLIDEAFRFICQMPIEPDISVWGAFLGACRIHGKFDVGKVLRDQLVDLGTKEAGYYKLLLNIYGSNGDWDGVLKIRNLMDERGVKIISGSCLIETNG